MMANSPIKTSSRRLLIGCYFPRSVTLEGIGTFVRGIANQMTREGWRVQLLWPDDCQIDDSRIEMLGYQPGTLGLSRYLQLLRTASRSNDAVLLVENNPNMGFAASYSETSGPTCTYFCTPLQLPTDLRGLGWGRQAWVHGVAKNPLWSRLQNWSQRRCLVATEYQARQLRGLNAAEVHVLPASGVSCHRAVPDRVTARQILGWDDRPIVGYLGHFSTAKGVHVLVDAFEKVTDRSTVLALAHSGKGTLPSKQSQKLMTLAASGRARVLGVVDPLTFLAACDVIALPYVTSSIYHIPQVMLESFAAATPVISTQVGGAGELLDPAATGMLVPPLDRNQLTTAIETCLTDQRRCHELGQSARQLFVNKLSTEVFCEQLSRLLSPRSLEQELSVAA